MESIMRPFQKPDWCGYSGAEEAPGQPPMIGSREFAKDEGMVIVADIKGINIYYLNDNIKDQKGNGMEINWYKECSYRTSLLLSELLETHKDIVVFGLGSLLDDLGFKHV
jgi:hypothetical protein